MTPICDEHAACRSKSESGRVTDELKRLQEKVRRLEVELATIEQRVRRDCLLVLEDGIRKHPTSDRDGREGRVLKWALDRLKG